MAATSRGGRPSKGDRVVVVSRPHRVVHDRIRGDAEKLGISMSEYVSLVLANALDLDQYAPALPHQDEELPLGRTA